MDPLSLQGPSLHDTAPPVARRWRTALALAGFALAVRLAVLAATVAVGVAGGPEPGAAAAGPVSGSDVLTAVAALHDGADYLALARAWGSPEEGAGLPPVVQRLGPGYPLLIRVASHLVPPPWAALALALLGAALATVLVYRLGVSARGAALFAVLTPSWVAFSSTAMSEGPFLALALAGLLAWGPTGERAAHGGAPHPATPAGSVVRPAERMSRWIREAGAGLLFGASALVRPVGAVLFLALWGLRIARGGGRGRRGADPAPEEGRRGPVPGRAVVSVAAFLVPPLGVWIAASAGLTTQLRTYLRHDLAAPLASLWNGFSAPAADPLKTAQNLLVLGLFILAGWWLLAPLLRSPRRLSPAPVIDRPAAEVWLVWLGSQVLFYLLLPSAWVFECLARFLVTALPAVAAGLAPRLPRKGWRFGLLLIVLTAFSAGVSLLWNVRALGFELPGMADLPGAERSAPGFFP